jgi:hypothetical protein
MKRRIHARVEEADGLEGGMKVKQRSWSKKTIDAARRS